MTQLLAEKFFFCSISFLELDPRTRHTLNLNFGKQAVKIHLTTKFRDIDLLNMGSVSKDYYYKLASELESERIAAAAGLIKELSENDLEDDWNYAIDRLIKGLGSQRASARLGFSLSW